MRTIIITLFCLFLVSCTLQNTQEILSEETINTEQVKDNSDDLWKLYCDLGYMIELYTIAPESQFYYDAMQNGSDVSSQRAIMMQILAQLAILDINGQITELTNTKSKYPNTNRLLIESAQNIYSSFIGMKDIQSVDDFKANIMGFGVGATLLGTIPDQIVKENTNHELFLVSQDIGETFLMCNNHVDIEFWGGYAEEEELFTEQLYEPQSSQMGMLDFTEDDIYIGLTTENVYIRENPNTNGKKLALVPKGTFILYTPFHTLVRDGYTWHAAHYEEEDATGFIAGDYVTYITSIDELNNNNDTSSLNSYYNKQTFRGYDCLTDCSGHEAGYNWAMKKGITNKRNCGGNSQSFIEGCWAYVEGL